MKKLLVVLTILALAAGFAFAAISGSVEAGYKFDFTNETADYGIKGSHADIQFTINSDKGFSEGERKPYATATVALSLTSEKINKADNVALTYTGEYKFSDIPGSTPLNVVLQLKEFKIVGENWEVDFLKAIGAGDYAKSAWEISGDDKALDMNWSFADKKGITVTYDGYKVGLHADTKRNLPNPTTNVDLRAESKEIAVAEGITVQAAGALGYSKEGDEDAKVNFGISVKGAYASDAVSASVAADFQNFAEKFDADVAAKVEVAPVTVDAYYATSLKAEPKFAIGDYENYLSVRAIVDVEKVAENVPMKVTLYGENLLNDGRLLGVKEEGKFGKVSEDAQFGIYPSLPNTVLWFANATVGYDVAENVDVRVGAGLFDVVLKVEDDKFAFGAYAFNIGADYKHDLFTASADLYLAKEFAEEGSQREEGDLLASAKISVSSEKLVDNAVLSASLVFNEKGAEGLYKATRALDDFKDGDVAPAPATNCLTLSCKVSF